MIFSNTNTRLMAQPQGVCSRRHTCIEARGLCWSRSQIAGSTHTIDPCLRPHIIEYGDSLSCTLYTEYLFTFNKQSCYCIAFRWFFWKPITFLPHFLPKILLWYHNFLWLAWCKSSSSHHRSTRFSVFSFNLIWYDTQCHGFARVNSVNKRFLLFEMKAPHRAIWPAPTPFSAARHVSLFDRFKATFRSGRCDAISEFIVWQFWILAFWII